MAKHAGGRPPKHTEPDKLQILVDEYFAKCDEDKVPYTVTGLASALDLTRQGLTEYENKGEFSATIKKAKQKVVKSVEQRLLSGANATGAIFWLKNNAGWKDEQHQRMSFDFSKYTDEELEALIAGQGEA